MSASVGVIGLSQSGRTSLIESLENNVPVKLIYHELGYPSQGFTPADLSTYSNHIKQLKDRYNLSLLLLVVPDSFRDKEAVLVQAAQKNQLTVAVIITKFDGILDNLHPRKKTFTSAEKATQVNKEKNFPNQQLQKFNIAARVEVFIVSFLSFPSQLDKESEKYCCDEVSLCQFVQKNANQSATKNHSTSGAPLVKAATIQGFNCEYDILFFGVKNNGTTNVRNALKKFNDQLDMQNIEFDESTENVESKVKSVDRKITVIVIKNHIEDLKMYFEMFQRDNDMFIVLLNTTKPQEAKSMFSRLGGNSVPSNSVFAFDVNELENADLRNPEIKNFLEFLQDKTGKSMKPQAETTHQKGNKHILQTKKDLRGVLFISLDGANVQAIADVVAQTNEGNAGMKKVYYENDINKNEVVNDIKNSERHVIIVIPDSLFNRHRNLIQNLSENEKLDFVLILDCTKQHIHSSYAIQKSRDPSISYDKCFTLSLGSGLYDEMFLKYLGGSASSSVQQTLKEETFVHL
jgi:vacuolar-type H+-ATPase subunit F/Vma7